MINKALVLKQRPDETFPNNMDFFEVRTVPIPILNDGEILIQVYKTIHSKKGSLHWSRSSHESMVVRCQNVH